jgi:hypothetical protein
MHYDDYTPDTICRSMGMSAFIEPDWTVPTLRLLLKPSFHSEVCITLTGSGPARLSVVALTEMLWLRPRPCTMPAVTEDFSVPNAVIIQAIADFKTALTAENDPARKSVVCDGMGIACCAVTCAGLERFESNVNLPEVKRFVSGLIRLAWETCLLPEARNVLAACGGYVDLEYEHEPIPPGPEVVRILIVGTPEETADITRLVDGNARER